MIQNDTKALTKNKQIIFLPFSESKEELFNYAKSTSLFGDSPAVVYENFTELSNTEIELLKKSKTIFIFPEDKTKIKSKKIMEESPFSVADAFARKNKMETWATYLKLIEAGTAPEAIIGMLFWKVKTMILDNSKIFSKEQLKNFSCELVDLYHKAHKGECDMVIGLEQFILKALN